MALAMEDAGAPFGGLTLSIVLGWPSYISIVMLCLLVLEKRSNKLATLRNTPVPELSKGVAKALTKIHTTRHTPAFCKSISGSFVGGQARNVVTNSPLSWSWFSNGLTDGRNLLPTVNPGTGISHRVGPQSLRLSSHQ